MIRTVFATDAHAKGVNPSSRADNFPETIKNKVREYLRAGQELDVDFYTFGGDLLDSPYTTPSFINDIGDILEEGLKGKPFFYVLGNHDVIGYNPSTIKSTAYGTLLKFMPNAIRLEPTPQKYTFRGEDIYLSGVHSYTKLDRTIEQDDVTLHRSRDYVIEDALDAPSIHVVHGYLSKRKVLDDIPYTLIDEMKHTRATITLTGHEHTGFGVVQGDNGLICNPGAMGRVFASRTEMARMPKYALCTIDAGVPHIELIPFKGAKPGADVFDVEMIEERGRVKALIARSKEELSETLRTIDVKHVTIGSVLERLEDATEKPVFDEAKRRILGNHRTN